MSTLTSRRAQEVINNSYFFSFRRFRFNLGDRIQERMHPFRESASHNPADSIIEPDEPMDVISCLRVVLICSSAKKVEVR